MDDAEEGESTRTPPGDRSSMGDWSSRDGECDWSSREDDGDWLNKLIGESDL